MTVPRYFEWHVPKMEQYVWKVAIWLILKICWRNCMLSILKCIVFSRRKTQANSCIIKMNRGSGCRVVWKRSCNGAIEGGTAGRGEGAAFVEYIKATELRSSGKESTMYLYEVIIPDGMNCSVCVMGLKGGLVKAERGIVLKVYCLYAVTGLFWDLE